MLPISCEQSTFSAASKQKLSFLKRVRVSEAAIPPFSTISHSHVDIFWVGKRFWRCTMSPGIIVMANPDIIELQSDRATPAAQRTITLWPGSQWESCIRRKPQSF